MSETKGQQKAGECIVCHAKLLAGLQMCPLCLTAKLQQDADIDRADSAALAKDCKTFFATMQEEETKKAIRKHKSIERKQGCTLEEAETLRAMLKISRMQGAAVEAFDGLIDAWAENPLADAQDLS